MCIISESFLKKLIVLFEKLLFDWFFPMDYVLKSD